MATEIEHNGAQYRIDSLSVFQQLHLVRKVSPLVGPLMGVMEDFGEDTIDIDMAMRHIDPLTEQLAGLNDSTVEYVVDTALSHLKRYKDGGYYAVWSGGQFMYQDLGGQDALILTYKVLVDQLGPFMQGLLPSGEQESESGQMEHQSNENP